MVSVDLKNVMMGELLEEMVVHQHANGKSVEMVMYNLD